MRCSCGQDIPLDGRFCTACGAPLPAPPAPSSWATSPAVPVRGRQPEAVGYRLVSWLRRWRPRA